jgi:hypothetical protein
VSARCEQFGIQRVYCYDIHSGKVSCSLKDWRVFSCYNQDALFVLVFPASELSATGSDVPSFFCPDYVLVQASSFKEFYYLLCPLKVFKVIYCDNRKFSFKDVPSQAYESWVCGCCDCRSDCIAALFCVDLLAALLLFTSLGTWDTPLPEPQPVADVSIPA